MKIFLSLLFSSFLLTATVWKTNFIEAKTEASKDHKLMLVNFSGSDWCLPCIRLKKTIFESDDFNGYASENLVLVNADFPRQNKHKLSPEQKKMNEDLAAIYNPEGKFPYTLLMTAEGKILKQWDGLPDLSDKQFVDEIMQANANR
ncbi:MAG: thioredoxin family protein [Chitinophagaceae bacterium]|nr:thioredoxin family protein [Chitinophagaceae bacterium]